MRDRFFGGVLVIWGSYLMLMLFRGVSGEPPFLRPPYTAHAITILIAATIMILLGGYYVIQGSSRRHK
jgi:hypothetical protein